MKKMLTTSILPWATSLVVCWSVSAQAQGVHLSAGGSLTIGFDEINSCRFTEGIGGSHVYIDFGNDLLGPSETLGLEMFENSVGEVPLATATYSPVTSVTFVDLRGPYSWADHQGVIRITMFTGSVEVTGADFIAAPNVFTYCPFSIAVPEPNSFMLITFGGSVAAVVSIYSRKKSNAYNATS